MTATDNATALGIDIGRVALQADALGRIPRALALKHDILSLSSEGNEITIAIPDINDREAIDRVRLVTGMHVVALRASRESIRSRLSEAYGSPGQQAAVRAGDFRGDEAPAIRALDEIYAGAIAANASDIHVEPTSRGGRVRQRVDGILYETAELPSELHAQVVSRLKLLAGMDIADRRQPQDGRYAVEMQGRLVEARVNSMPTIGGEKLAVRLLDNHAGIPDLEDLGMPAVCLDRFRRALHAPHGFVVVCGPTGSGKTTTLYAAMAERNTESQNLCSVEDPVEVRLPGVAQVQINARAGVTFAGALRSLLRQDPNVIMVGETRDEETAAMAASASLSGQLVLTTLHANDAPRAIDRLIELGVSRYTIAAGLTAVLSQRLVRLLCDYCRSTGCARCNRTGYSGRTAIFEWLFIDDALRMSIARGDSGIELSAQARARGYAPMLVEGLELVKAGRTRLEELHRVLPVVNAQ